MKILNDIVKRADDVRLNPMTSGSEMELAEQRVDLEPVLISLDIER